MSQSISEMIDPLVKNGLFESPEAAVQNLMMDYILRQIEHFQLIIQTFEKKHGMTYHQFNNYLSARAQKVQTDKSLHPQFMSEEEDALDWKIAHEMLGSWLGLKRKSAS